MNSKYNQYWYWESLVMRDQPLWHNSFCKLPLTRDSIFIYSMIMDKEKGVLKNAWAYYPDIKSLLGFIEHVFLPTAFFTWLDDEGEGFNIPVATVDEVLYVMKQNNKDSSIPIMNEYIDNIRLLWDMNDEESLLELRKISKQFNMQWKENDDKILYFRIFKDSLEISDFIFKGEDGYFFEEVIEEDIGMKRTQWEETCKNVLD